MENTKVGVLPRIKTDKLVWFLALTTVVTLAPLINLQLVTGPLVNATLFVAVVMLGVETAIFVGLIPSLIALSVGLLPAPLAPTVPFIMMSNALLILVFAIFRNKNYWMGMISASVLKFIFLYAVSSVVINLLLQRALAPKVALMLSWPQLATALVGGVIAFIFLKIIKKV